jgi:hypothetical protein
MRADWYLCLGSAPLVEIINVLRRKYDPTSYEIFLDIHSG